ncbi:hypothetical protein [Streptomyces cavernae]|uniref:hypothetical protein n=1 Tax=Streptomyces cavernae TaxID=2259034 RepID=UPI001EE3E10F|nr:hypothetical protein [Streptomyces cavernae]
MDLFCERAHVPYAVLRRAGTLQTVWDRVLSRKPVVLILIGSVLATTEQLSAYGHPFHQTG